MACLGIGRHEGFETTDSKPPVRAWAHEGTLHEGRTEDGTIINDHEIASRRKKRLV